jgi:tripartite-type tricarboxylate transporter receptor subunit TctC
MRSLSDTQRKSWKRHRSILFRFSVLAGTAAWLVGSTARLFAEEWPLRPVKIVVPYGAGGVTDIVARLYADQLGKKFGQPFFVENRPGAGSAIGTEYVVRAPPDGYTLILLGSGQFSIVPLMQKLNYDPLSQLAPLSIVGTNGLGIAVAKGSPHQTLEDFIAFARRNPGKVSYSSSGTGGNSHLAGAALGAKASIDIQHVPFGSGPAALNAVMSDAVQMNFANSSDIIEPSRGSDAKIKILAVSTPQRFLQLPKIQTVSETVPGFGLTVWNGFFAPAGLSSNIVDAASKAIIAISHDPEMVARLAILGVEATGSTPNEVSELIRSDLPVFAEAVDAAGLRRK